MPASLRASSVLRGPGGGARIRARFRPPAAPMSFHLSSRLKFAVAWSVVGLLGVLGGWLNYRARESEMMRHLLAHARLSAVAIPTGELDRLRGGREDVGTPSYRELKDRLRRLKAVEPSVRFVYVFRAAPGTKQVIYLGIPRSRAPRTSRCPATTIRRRRTRRGCSESCARASPRRRGRWPTILGCG